MVEVFKTNVKYPDQAHLLIVLIQEIFNDYKVNFDLHDCDNILRVESKTGSIQTNLLINVMKGLGFNAEILPDEYQIIDHLTEIKKQSMK